MRRNIDKNSLIKYKWEQGVYGIKDMVSLVEIGTITSENFKEITRKDYKAIREKIKKQEIL